MLLPGSFKASITQAATHDNLEDLPGLIYSESMSSPNTDELHPIDDLCLSQDVLHQEVHSERKWLRDLPEGLPHEYESPLPRRRPSSLSTHAPGPRHAFPHRESAAITTSMEEWTRKS